MSYTALGENSRALEGLGVSLHRSFHSKDSVNVLDIHVDVADYNRHFSFLTTYLKRAALLFGVVDADSVHRLGEIDLSIRPRQDLLDELDQDKKKELEELVKGYREAYNDLSLLTRLSRPVYRKFDGNDVLLLQLGRLLELPEKTPEQVLHHQAIRRQFLLTDLVVDYAQCMHGGTSYSPAEFLEAVAEEGNLGKAANARFEDIDVVYRFRDDVQGRNQPTPSINQKRSSSIPKEPLFSSIERLTTKIGENTDAYVASRL